MDASPNQHIANEASPRIITWICPSCEKKHRHPDDSGPHFCINGCSLEDENILLVPSRMIFALPKIRMADELEDEVEINLEDPLAVLMRVRCHIDNDLSLQESRYQAAKTARDSAKNRVVVFDDFLQAKYKEFIKANARKGKKSADCNLAAVGMPDVTVRIQQRKMPNLFKFDNGLIIDHFTTDALPTDSEKGPCKKVPEHWTIDLAGLKRLVKEGEEIPGVETEERNDKCYAKEDLAKK